MRIASDKKLELQARKVVVPEPDVKMSDEWISKYQELYKIHWQILKEWEPFRDKCHEQSHGEPGKCICTTFPEYHSYLTKITLVSKELNDMSSEKELLIEKKHQKEELAYQLELARLKSVRSTKLKYHNSR